MANDEGRDPPQAGTKVDRRSIVTGGAAAAVTTAMPGAALAQTASSSPQARILTPIYLDPTYLGTFNNSTYAPGNIDNVHKFITDNYSRDGLKWGLYQKDLEDDPNNWGKP